MRRFLPWAAAVALVVACGGGERRSGDARALNLVLETSPNRLDPANVVDVAEGEICALLFQGLVKFSADGEVVPGLAREWEVDETGTRYAFRLDPRMRFSNGGPVTSADVIRSVRRVLTPESRSPRKWVLERIRGARAFADGGADSIAGLSAPDSHRVTIELDEPFAPFLSMLALPAAMVVADVDDAGQVPVGSGPWVLSEWKRGDRIVLVPNPHHPDASTALDEIRYRIIPEAFTRVAEYESGALDVMEIPHAELRRFLDDPSYAARIQSRSELRVYYIGLNNRDPKFSDVRVRRALNMAVNVEQLIDVLAGGEATLAAGSIPPTLPGYRERPRMPFDPAAARRLLAEAGYPDGFAMEIWQRESPEGNRVLEAVQGYLAQVGIEVRLVRREWSAFKEAVSAGKVDAFLLDWFADYPDAENFLYPLFHSSNAGGGGNRAFFHDETVDRWIDRASATLDPEERTELYARIDSLVYDRAPWLYLYFPRAFYAVSERVTGYRVPTLYLGADFGEVRKTN